MRRLVSILLVGPLLLCSAAVAQVKAPSLVEEDLAPEEPRPAPAAPAEPPPPPPRAATPPQREVPQPKAIEPVKGSWDGLLQAWKERRRALREQDAPAARAAARRLLDLKRELGIENLQAHAASEVREVERTRRARLPADAVEHAELAVQLAPDLADAHLALARARLARDPSQPGAAAAPLWAAILAAVAEPHTSRAFLGDVLGAALAALVAAAALTLLLLGLRHVRPMLHDFGHLPLVRLATPLQAGFLALVLLGLPLAAGFGPWVALAVLAAATWLYLSNAERLVALAALAALALLPWAAAGSARLTAWTGSLAEDVFEIERGADAGERVARLSSRDRLPPPALVAIGRWHKRRGALGEAQRWYDKALEAGGRTPDLLVNMGNVKFLQGDADGAKALWLDAADRAVDAPVALAAASYNLGKLYLRQAALEQSQQARRRAEQLAPELLARYGSDDDFRANRWILDVPVDRRAIDPLAADDDTPALAAEAVRSRLSGLVPPAAWPFLPLGLLALLLLSTPLLRPVRHSASCERCGRSACPRCDAQAGPLCGQCVNVFVRRGVVEARDRQRKEAQVRRHELRQRWGTRLLALCSGGAGHVWHGEALRGFLLMLGLAFAVFVLVFWRGLVPPPHPSPYLLVGKLAAALPLALLLYGLAVRDAFRRSRD
ncbi:MAG: tetratricopeptide repeat protein [Deltaproteobacteria bacterium]|nr:tetratricopeptide repeat protein [Deltaproteobacteria bacterium]